MFSQDLADRVEDQLRAGNVLFESKKMFGGVCFMVDDKMCVGVVKDELMVRLDPDFYEEALAREGARQMDFTNRPMKGFVFVEAHALETDDGLGEWLRLALEYNPKARSSKRRK
jgi:TfoX/Sxy family transcriptional regulator of competence genes